MHTCLQVEDIVHEIIKVFSDARDRRSITTVARTCKAFHEPAMDALWRKMDGLGPLLECMPGDLLCEKYVPATWAEPFLDVQAYFTREPTIAEWDQMFKHAHRVRELTLGMGLPPTKLHRSASTYSATIMISIVKHMQKRVMGQQNTPLFPNLMVLRCRWYNRLQGTLACIPYLAGLSIKTVRIYGNVTSEPSNVEPLDIFLATVFESYPSIQDLTLVADSGPAEQFQPCTGVLSNFVERAHDFRAFQSNVPLTTNAVSQLLSMPYISTLTIQLPDDLPPLDACTFTGSLGSVDISARYLDTCTNFISAIQTSHMKTINIQASESCDPYSVARCFKALQAHIFLTRIRIFADRAKSADRPVCMIPGSTLALLYPLSGLHGLVLEEHIEVDLYDQDALALSKAWPCLRNLTFMAIQESIRPNIRPHLTLAGIIHLVRNCKHLRRLGIAFDASNIDVNLLDEGINSGPIGENLFMLEVHAPLSPVLHPQKMAHFLHAIFPNLRILSFGESDIGMYDGWSRVWRMVRTLLFRRAVV
ncbi:hypothetical protein BC629DRAFT_1436394 [Irpex lacteus]|nr:hypothetical protein BC629DRAFT_1436394 [Irpex lacteus]